MMMSQEGMGQQKMAPYLPPLRDDLQLMPGPVLDNGAPSWTLHDPSRNLFFRIGWQEFEMLARWSKTGRKRISAQELQERVNSETTLEIEPDTINGLQMFLLVNSLLEPSSEEILSFLKKKQENRPGLLTTLLHSYLSFRIPLFKPDRFLTATMPFVRFFYSKIFFCLLGFGFLLSFYLTLRYWHVFTSTFLYFFTAEGFLYYGLALTLAKTLHEFGHAYTAKRYNVNVPTMGVAFLVLWPMAYSDTSESWKLADRKSRMKIVAAGTFTEIIVAVIASLLWHALPDGPLRSACFILATVTWVSSLVLNLSPFMRFDGYFLLSDLLDIPNLQARAFALGKWQMRRLFWGMEEDIPEQTSDKKKYIMIGYAYCTWLYRLIIFTGIALLVYAKFFKVLGIFLFLVEICWFLLLPISKEMHYWWIHRTEMGYCSKNFLFSMFVLILFLALLVLPWRSTIVVPGLLSSARFQKMYPPFAGRIEEVRIRSGEFVEKGQIMFRLSSPTLNYRMKLAETRISMLELQLTRQITNSEILSPRDIIEKQLAQTMEELQGIKSEQKRLTLRAKLTGTAVDVAPDLRHGLWVNSDRLLAMVVDRRALTAEGYVQEESLNSIAVGSRAEFLPEIIESPVLACEVTDIDTTSSRVITSPYLVSVYGGPIPVRLDREKRYVSDKSFYRIRVQFTEPAGYLQDQVSRGKVAIQGKAESLAMRSLKRMQAVLIRESGF